MSLNGGGGVGLGFELTADDAMSGVLDKANQSVARLHEGITKLGQVSDSALASVANIGMAIYNAGKGFLQGAFDLAKTSGGPFEAAMHEVEHFTHASAEQMELMQDAVFSAQNALMGFSALDTAKALRELGQLTGNADEALQKLEPSLLLAGITGKSTEAAVRALQKTTHDFGIGAEDTGEFVDQLAKSADLFHVKAGAMQDALGRVSAGAKAMGMSAADSMLTIGLMGKGLGDLGKTAGEANMLMMRLGRDSKAQSALEKLGIETKNAAGQLRNLPDMLGQIADKQDKLTDQEIKSAFAKAGATRASGELLKVVRELGKGVTDESGVVHRGSDAIKFYAEQQDKAAGAARRLLDAQLDTFEGQEKVMKAAIESVKTGLAAPLAAAFKPIISAIAGGLASIVEFFNKIDPETKKFMAQVVLLGGVLVTVLGAAFVFLGGPATVAIFALIAAGAALYEAYRSNIGGLADFVDRSIGRVKTAFEALSSLFSKGGMSLEVFHALEKDPALMNFVLNVFVLVNRVKSFFGGMVDGFQAGVARLAPVFTALSDAVASVMSRFGGLGAAIDPLANGTAFSGAAAKGAALGDVIATIAGVLAKVATAVAYVVDGFVSGWGLISSATDGLGDTFRGLGEDIMDILRELGLANGQASDTAGIFQSIGHAIAGVFGGMASIVRSAISMSIGLWRAFANVIGGVVEIIAGIFTGNWAEMWTGMRRVAFGVVSAIIAMVSGMVQAIAGAVDALGALVGKDFGAAAKVRGFFAGTNDAIKASLGLGAPGAEPAGPAGPPAAAPVYGPPAPPATTPGGAGAFPAGEAAGGAPAGGDTAQHVADAVKAVASKPTTVNVRTTLLLDTAVVAEHIAAHHAGEGDRAGVPQATPS